MDSAKTIKQQIIIRAMQQPHMATDVVGGHAGALFKDNLEQVTISSVVTRYFYTHKQPLTRDTLNSLLGNQISILVKNGELEDANIINRYFKDADTLLTSKVDTSDEMTDMVSHYVHSRLARYAIMYNSLKYKHNPQYDLLGNLRKSLDKVNSLDVTGEGNQVISVLNPHDFPKEQQAFKELNRNKIPMGLSNIDAATNHGIEKGSTNLINASSGSGKSTVLSNFSISYIEEGYNVFHISLEELASDMLIRFVRILLGMTPSELFTSSGKLDPKAERTIQKRFGLLHSNSDGRLGQLFFYRTSPRTLTVDGLRQLIVSTERLHHIKFDVIVLDYPALLINPYSYHGTNESSAGEKLFQDLKKLSLDTNTVMWLASQLNRMAGSADVKSSQFLEGSYRKTNSVNTSFTLNRSSAEFQNNCFKLHVDKLRNRDNFQDEFLYFKYHNMRIIPETDSEIKQHQQLNNQARSKSNMQYRNNQKKLHNDQFKMLNG